MILFGDKNTGQYVEITQNEFHMAIIHWVNYPYEIIYHNDSRDETVYNHVVEEFVRVFNGCNDLTHARKILDNMSSKEKIVRTVEEVRGMQNKAFDMQDGYDEYLAGFFDALGWVLGDELDEEIWGENNV